MTTTAWAIKVPDGHYITNTAWTKNMATTHAACMALAGVSCEVLQVNITEAQE